MYVVVIKKEGCIDWYDELSVYNIYGCVIDIGP